MVYFLILLAFIIIADISFVGLCAAFICDRKFEKAPLFIKRIFFGKSYGKNKSKSKSRLRADELKTKISEEYELYASDGTRLCAHYYPCENAKRLVIAVHGWRSEWSYDFNAQSEFLHNNDCAMLYVDLRAHGNSGGRYMYFGKKERFELKQWLDFAKSNISDKLPVYFYGLSMGSTLSVMASSLCNRGELAGIIADGVSTTPRDVICYMLKAYKINTVFYPQIRFAMRMMLKADDNDFTTLDALETSTAPLLIINGTSDPFTPFEMSERVYNACTSEKYIVGFDGASHMKSYFTDTEKYKKAVVDFFENCENSNA